MSKSMQSPISLWTSGFLPVFYSKTYPYSPAYLQTIVILKEDSQQFNFSFW